MSPAAEILVIILSIFLAIFLLLGIILFIYLIRLSAEIKKITESARQTFEDVEHAVHGVSKLTSPLFVANMLKGPLKKLIKSYQKKGK